MSALHGVRAPRLTALLVLTLITGLHGCGPEGERYDDVDAIGMAESWQGWVVVGRFGHAGPFTLTDVEYCEAGAPCTFSHQGQGHSYEGFDQFQLAILRLEGLDNEVAHVVLRSNNRIVNRN